jgi:threonine aldolase
MEINLISDTITKPTNEMLQYMFKAVVGDDVYKQDPTVIELEVAAMFGMRQDFSSFWNNGQSNCDKITYTTRGTIDR